MGEALTEVTQAMHNGETLPTSMRTAMMIFGTKPKKPKSIEPKDKRRISLLNCDFNPTSEGVQILWVGGGGASEAPPKKSMMEWADTP